ncbi:MAG: hypothetical protein HQL72_09270 [Magnetococcales bacterium]|nr:hypothetical protein [Magnetococcales bacterium]
MESTLTPRTERILNIFNTRKPAPVNRYKIVSAALASALLLSWGGWYFHYQHQPLPPDKHATLANQVKKRSQQTGQTRRKIWNQVKMGLEIRRIDQLQNRHYEKVLELL